MKQLKERVAIVTGAGQGIGRGVARRFAREGADVVIAELSEEHGRKVEAEVKELGGRAVFIKTDVGKKEDVLAMVAKAVDHFGRLDILVNNAFTEAPPVLMADKTDEMLEKQLKVSVWGAWWAMQAAYPIMRKQRWGSIINYTSMDVDLGAWLHADYNIVKAGIVGLTRSAAVDWGRFNIRANIVAPIAASTAFERLCKVLPGFRDMAKGPIPLGRMGDPEEDIAPAIVFLCSDAARFITGVTLPIDGGLHMPRGAIIPEELIAKDVD